MSRRGFPLGEWRPCAGSQVSSAGPTPAPSPLFCTRGGFKPFQYKPVVIAWRDLGFLWILAQSRLLSTSQGKCTDSLIYAPTFCWDLNNFMTQSFSSSTCWPHCTAIIAQQMWVAVGHPADDKRCGDSSGSLRFSPSFSSSQVLPGRKRCQ